MKPACFLQHFQCSWITKCTFNHTFHSTNTSFRPQNNHPPLHPLKSLNVSRVLWNCCHAKAMCLHCTANVSILYCATCVHSYPAQSIERKGCRHGKCCFHVMPLYYQCAKLHRTWDVMSFPVDCILQACNHKTHAQYMESRWNYSSLQKYAIY